jgi:hypothetical protein
MPTTVRSHRTTTLDNVACFPPALLARPRWVLWRWQRREGRWTKPPFQAAHPQQSASSTDPATWSTFAVARQAYEAGHAHGLGYVLGEGVFGIDYDHCLPGDAIPSWVQQTIDRLQTYAERSPSGDGLHLLGYGTLPGTVRKTDGIECYDHDRYFTVTMQPVSTYGLRDCAEVLPLWYQTAFGARTDASSATGWRTIRVTFSPTAQPPLAPFVALMKTPKAQKTWDCLRTDLQDTSLSGHQFSLALLALHRGWDDQALCDLLVAHRASQTTDLKRLDYYQRTIWGAHERLAAQDAQETLQQSTTAASLTPEDIRAHLARVLGCTIVRLTQEGVENATFSVQLNGHLIVLGGARAFRDQANWQDLLVTHGFRPFDRMKEPLWNNVLDAMLHLVERHPNPDTPWTAWLLHAVQVYFQDEGRDVAYHTLVQCLPLRTPSSIGLHLEHFRQWVGVRFPDAVHIDRSACMTLLRQLGFLRKQLSAREDDKVVTRQYWMVADSLLTLADLSEDTPSSPQDL